MNSEEPRHCLRRWRSETRRGDHVCTELFTHTVHRCCCGAMLELPMPIRRSDEDGTANG